MNWLRIPELIAGEAYVGEKGGEQVLFVPCTVAGPPDIPLCCLDRRLVGFGQPEVQYRDRRIEPMPTWLKINKRKFRCQHCGRYPAENIPGVDEDHFITARLREDIRLSALNRPFNDAVRLHAIEETLVQKVFHKYAKAEMDRYRYKAPRVLGIDENSLGGKARGVICDADNGLLLDLVEGYKQDDMIEAMEAHMEDWGNVEVWCQDMSLTFKGLHHKRFAQSTMVIDKWHVLKRSNEIFDTVRRRATPDLPANLRQSIGRRKNLFLAHYDTADTKTQDRIMSYLEHSPEMKRAYDIKEWFYQFYESRDRQDAEEAYKEWVASARAVNHPDWQPLMRMVQNWRNEIFSYFDVFYTSAKVENLNLQLVKLNQAGYGHHFETLRAKAILRYGGLIAEDRFRYYAEEFGTGWLDDCLEPDAASEDEDRPVLVGSGVDLSTVIAAVEAGEF